ncbi:MAG: peptidylprolyl isomerase [Ardenticatenaceae bacterium]|nr:peptidylprolyl isomerase [Ardenticatenaceae bacterium]
MGNAIFIAAYLIMVVPFTLARIVDAFTNILGDEELSYADIIRASVYIFTLAIQLLAIYWSSSRGPWLGLGSGLFAFVLILLVSLRNAAPSQKRVGLMDIGRVLLLIVGGIALSFFVFDFLVNQITASGKLASLAGPMGSFVAFAASIGVITLAIFLMVAVRRGWRWLWLSWLLLALVLVVWLGVFNFAGTLDEQFGGTPVLGDMTATLVEWHSLPSIGRLGRLLESEGGTGRVRVLIWTGALELISPHEPLVYPDGSQDSFNFLRPLIGYGPESMYVAYNRFYPPELGTVEARNASPDRSHNETFDAIVITGALGFLVWQALYLSVFYFGFKWLGVVQSRRDRNLLIAFWIGGAVVGTALITQTLGAPFIGVAIPFGSIIGLVLYLVYYALFVPSLADAAEMEPFQVDRLLMIGLVTAVLAHYVEIHFGIAIAATRLHFFVYVALMYVLGQVQHIQQEEPVVETKVRRRKGRATITTSKDVWGPALLYGLVLLLLVGIIGFEFMTYSLPPGKVIESASDLSAGEILHQSLFVNPSKEFADSPFIFLMMIMTWGLGLLLSLSEMVKSGELEFSMVAPELRANRRQSGVVLFALSFLVSALGAGYLYTAVRSTTVTGSLGRTLLDLWALLSLVAAIFLYQNREGGRFQAAAIALTGFLFAVPLLISGAIWQGVLLGIITSILLYLLWDGQWKQSLLPAGVMGITSLGGGLFYAFIQANLIKSSIAPTVTQEFATIQDLRVFEAGLATNFLTVFYIFVISVLFIGAFLVARQRARTFGQSTAVLALVFLFGFAFWGLAQTNMRVIQADMVFKRGKPFETQATQLGRNQQTLADGITAWDNTIAIYEDALRMAPREDFYYLFLGRAYLERSTIEPDPIVQQQLFDDAEQRLLLAQDINPLNTDHTANLARLNTRLAQLATDATTRQERLDAAESYYQTALSLSPQNSTIRNELAVLTLDLKQDCEGALAIYQESLDIDPFFSDTYFAEADAYLNCAAALPVEERNDYYANAADALAGGLDYNQKNARAWLQLGQIRQELGDYEPAIFAYDNALEYDTRGSLPAWNINYLIATSYQNLGDKDAAIAAAQMALAQAPTEVAVQVQQLLLDLGVNESDLPQIQPESTTPVQGERPLAALNPADRNNYYTAPPAFTIDPANAYIATIHTERGDIRVRLFDDEAPIAVNNFVFLARQGFYDNTTFHRVLADFMAQAGDPTGIGTGGPGYEFPNEVNNGLTFDRPGLLAMANRGADTNGSQFFLTFAATPWLDNQYTIFGEIVEGSEVLSALTLRDPEANPNYLGDIIQSIEIEEIGE